MEIHRLKTYHDVIQHLERLGFQMIDNDPNSPNGLGVHAFIETCDQCGGAVKVIACIEDSAVVKRILDHLAQRSESGPAQTPPVRAPPRAAKPNGP